MNADEDHNLIKERDPRLRIGTDLYCVCVLGGGGGRLQRSTHKKQRNSGRSGDGGCLYFIDTDVFWYVSKHGA